VARGGEGRRTEAGGSYGLVLWYSYCKSIVGNRMSGHMYKGLRVEEF